jgi:hypothetical protein
MTALRRTRTYDEMHVRRLIKRKVNAAGGCDAVAQAIGYAPLAVDDMINGRLFIGKKLAVFAGFRRIFRYERIKG